MACPLVRQDGHGVSKDERFRLRAALCMTALLKSHETLRVKQTFITRGVCVFQCAWNAFGEGTLDVDICIGGNKGKKLSDFIRERLEKNPAQRYAVSWFKYFAKKTQILNSKNGFMSSVGWTTLLLRFWDARKKKCGENPTPSFLLRLFFC